MARDLRSPLTAAMELGGHELLLKADLKLRSEQEVASREAAKPWEVLAKSMFQARFKERADIYVLALEHCPTRAPRRLLDYASCASIWQASLAQDLPELARKLAVWIGLSETNVARRILLNVRLEDCVDVLSGALSRAEEDERWFITSRVLVRLGAQARGVIHGSPPLFYLLELAESKNGFKELSDALLSQLGVAIDQWEQPTALRGEEAAECPICLEALWNATPSAFVISDVISSVVKLYGGCARWRQCRPWMWSAWRSLSMVFARSGANTPGPCRWSASWPTVWRRNSPLSPGKWSVRPSQSKTILSDSEVDCVWTGDSEVSAFP